MVNIRVVHDEQTAGDATFTSAELQLGFIFRDPNGAARTDTTDTAANIVAGISSAVIGSSFMFQVYNTADAAETITIAGGTNVTTNGTLTIDQGKTRIFSIVCTNVTATSEAVMLYDRGVY